MSLAQQMGNIGSELGRARRCEAKNDRKNRDAALVRALALIDLTLSDRRWHARFKELARFREAVSHWFAESADYDISPEALEDYCTRFALRQ